MWKRLAIVAGWVVATSATAAITLAAVGQAGREVADRPAVPISAEDLVAGVGESTSTTQATTSTTSTVATGGSAASSSTSTTESGSSTTIGGTILPGLITESRTTPGGTVSVTASSGKLTLSAAIPAQGFTAEINTSGPTEIEVRFESHDDSAEYRVKASLESGEIHWEIRSDIDD